MTFTEAEIATARRSKRVTVCDQEKYDEGPFHFEGTLADVIASLERIKQEIPAEYQEIATCEIDSNSGWEDSHYAHIEVTYERPETDQEVAARLHAERERARHELAAKKALHARLTKELSDQ